MACLGRPRVYGRSIRPPGSSLSALTPAQNPRLATCLRPRTSATGLRPCTKRRNHRNPRRRRCMLSPPTWEVHKASLHPGQRHLILRLPRARACGNTRPRWTRPIKMTQARDGLRRARQTPSTRSGAGHPRHLLARIAVPTRHQNGGEVLMALARCAMPVSDLQKSATISTPSLLDACSTPMLTVTSFPTLNLDHPL